MTPRYFNVDLKHLSPPPEKKFDVGEHLVGGFLVAVILLILIGAIK